MVSITFYSIWPNNMKLCNYSYIKKGTTGVYLFLPCYKYYARQ